MMRYLHAERTAAGAVRCTGCACLYALQLPAKQYRRPSPPVERRSAWVQPPPGPRDGCDEFHDLAGALASRPVRSEWPSMTLPALALEYFLQVISLSAGNAV